MRIVALLTDAYGGFGGIAVHNRDILAAMCAHSRITSVRALPRKITRDLGSLPDGLEYRVEASAGSAAFIRSAVAEALRSPRPDLIYCAHVNLAPVALALRYRFQAPVLCALHGIDAWQPTGRRTVNYAARQLNRFYAVSRITRTRFAEWSGIDPARIDLLPNAVHLDHYGIAPPSTVILERYGLRGRKVLLTVGRIVSKERAKGFDEVIDALPALVQRVPEVRYVIAGDGDYRTDLERKVSNAGLSDRVVFTGLISESEKLDLYRAADVYVMPSRGEGFGFVFLEAMACGTPCIASSVDGSSDAVCNGALGAMVDPDDPDALVEAIIEALDKPRRIPDGLDHFAYPAFVERVHGIIDSMTLSLAKGAA